MRLKNMTQYTLTYEVKRVGKSNHDDVEKGCVPSNCISTIKAGKEVEEITFLLAYAMPDEEEKTDFFFESF